MKDSHKRIVLSTFEHVDKALREIQNLTTRHVDEENSLFMNEEIYLTPGKNNRLSDEMSQARKTMRGFMKKYKIKNPAPISPVTIISSMIFSLDIAVSELEPRYSGSYGELEEKEQTELTNLSQKLHEHLDAIKEIIKETNA